LEHLCKQDPYLFKHSESFAVVSSLAGALSLLTACGSVSISNPDFYAAITVPGTSLRVNQQMQTTRVSQATGAPLTYYVNGVQGGNAELGTIDSNGLYTAPAIVPVPNSVTITSVAANDPNFPPGSVTLAVLNPIPVLNRYAFRLFRRHDHGHVSGSQFVYGAQILWNGVAVPTTLMSGSQLVAAIPAPNPGTFPLLVSNPNPGAANSSTLPVLVGPGQVVLTLQPASGTDVRVSNTLNLGLNVAGTNHTGVTLQVNGSPVAMRRWARQRLKPMAPSIMSHLPWFPRPITSCSSPSPASITPRFRLSRTFRF
jgi:hypothetical protein